MFGSSSSLLLVLALAAAPPAADDPAPIYEPVPDAVAAAVRNPHDRGGRLFCQKCHVPEGKLRQPISALCSGCHKLPRDNHPVQVAPRTPPRSQAAPLTDGLVTCVSCHDPHDGKAKLRLQQRQLCPICHPAK
jgi:predicted CXXCH cytochrome family protein